MNLLGERLKYLRGKLGYSQKEIAKILNLTQSAYGYYEQGRNEPSLETLIKIAETFNVSIDYLLGLSNTFEKDALYTMNDNLSLSNAEIKTIQIMKQNSLLKKLSKDPSNNVNRLNRFWIFMSRELKIK